jgi:hypothetical protein
VAIERMVSMLIKCTPGDVELLTDIAQLVLGHFVGSGKRSRKIARHTVSPAAFAVRRRPRP